ncbi:MAG: hypothetical protein MJ151_00735, partial [Lachnospiraceae bacterium]|nr:hypothetical protein [Lachnospiraceae bacterium]
VSLDLNSHHIYISTISECIYIEDATFNLYDTSVDLSTYEYFDEKDIKEKVGFIESMINKSIVIKTKNSIINLYGGMIKASKGAAAIVSYDSDITIEGALVYGGDGIDKDKEKGEDGSSAIVFNADNENNKIYAIKGYVRGGNGGKGRGKTTGLAGEGVKTNDIFQMMGDYQKGPFSGYIGEAGGGNGGVAIVIDAPFGYDTLHIDDGKIYGGNGGKSSKPLMKINLLGDTPLEPTYYDTRDNYATSIKDQGSTNVCWAFSTIASAEVGIRKDNATFADTLKNPNMDNEVDLSEIQFAYYFFSPQEDPLKIAGDSSIIGADYLSVGADIRMSNVALSQGKGVAKGSDYKEKPSIAALGGNEKTTLFSNKETLRSAIQAAVADDDHKYDLPVRMEKSVIVSRSNYEAGVEGDKAFSTEMKKYIKEYGAVQLSVASVGANHSPTYEEGGVNYTPWNRSYAAQPDHAVLAIGWDDNYDKTKFSPQPSSNGAILIKNSWGENSGYYWMPYEWPHDTNVSVFVAMKWKEANKEENLYYVDGGYWGGAINCTALANTYKIQKEFENIKAVSFFHLETADTKNIKADVKVYKFDNETLTNIASVNNQVITPGYNVIDVPNVVVKKNEEIMVTLENIKNVSTGDSDGAKIFYAKNVDSGGITFKHTPIHETSLVKQGAGWLSIDNYDMNMRVRLITENYYPTPTDATFYNSFKDGFVTSLKNQGNTQLCNIFSHVAAAETYILKNDATYADTLKGGNSELDLSEEHLSYFVTNNFNDPLHQSSNAGSSAGNYKPGIGRSNIHMQSFLMSQGGIALESDYPWVNATYTSTYTWDKNKIKVLLKSMKQKSFMYNSSNTVAQNYTEFTASGGFLENLKNDIKNLGGVVIDINPNSLTAGMYKTTRNSIPITDYGRKYFDMYYSTFGLTNDNCCFANIKYQQDNETYVAQALDEQHAMFAVGYDDNFPCGLFLNDGTNNARPLRNGAIMVKNSQDAKYYFFPYDLLFKQPKFTYYAYEWMRSSDAYENNYFITNTYPNSSGNWDFQAISNEYKIQHEGEKIKEVNFLIREDLDNMELRIINIPYGVTVENAYNDAANVLYTKQNLNFYQGINNITIDSDIGLLQNDELLIETYKSEKDLVYK